MSQGSEATALTYEGIENMFKISFTQEDLQELKEALRDMKKSIKIYTFIDEGCQYCENTVELIDIIANSSPLVNGKRLLQHIIVDRREDPEPFSKFKISRVPTVALLEGYIRYTGMPAGEEVRGLVETLIRLSQESSGLSPLSVEKISSLKGKVYIEVVVTPSCPYCPYAALMANMFAYESYRKGNKLVIADTIEAYENSDIADGYGVLSVPTIAINKKVEFIGLPYEGQFLEKVVEHSENEAKREKEREKLMKLLKSIEED